MTASGFTGGGIFFDLNVKCLHLKVKDQ